MILVATDSKGGKSVIEGDYSKIKGIVQAAKSGDWPKGDIVSLVIYGSKVKQACRTAVPKETKPSKKAAKKVSSDPPEES